MQGIAVKAAAAAAGLTLLGLLWHTHESQRHFRHNVAIIAGYLEKDTLKKQLDHLRSHCVDRHPDSADLIEQSPSAPHEPHPTTSASSDDQVEVRARTNTRPKSLAHILADDHVNTQSKPTSDHLLRESTKDAELDRPYVIGMSSHVAENDLREHDSKHLDSTLVNRGSQSTILGSLDTSTVQAMPDSHALSGTSHADRAAALSTPQHQQSLTNDTDSEPQQDLIKQMLNHIEECRRSRENLRSKNKLMAIELRSARGRIRQLEDELANKLEKELKGLQRSNILENKSAPTLFHWLDDEEESTDALPAVTGHDDHFEIYCANGIPLHTERHSIQSGTWTRQPSPLRNSQVAGESSADL